MTARVGARLAAFTALASLAAVRCALWLQQALRRSVNGTDALARLLLFAAAYAYGGKQAPRDRVGAASGL